MKSNPTVRKSSRRRTVLACRASFVRCFPALVKVLASFALMLLLVLLCGILAL